MATTSSDLPTHPFADLLPSMSDAEYAELRDSIREHGQREPITLDSAGRVLDGRHRARACAELGLPVASRTFEGDDSEALDFVMDINVVRKHLDASQRAMIAADLETLGHGGARRGFQDAKLHLDRAAAAKALNVSPRSVADARAVIDSAIPAIVAAVRQGHLPVSQASQVARLSEATQHRVAGEIHNGKSTLTTVLAATRTERAANIEAASAACPLSALGRRFPVILADPPWAYETWSAGGQQKSAIQHYPCMAAADIGAIPVSDIAWGFEFKTSAVWVKPRIGCGHWFRIQHELLFCATRGSMPPPPRLHSSIFEGDTSGRHSEKPDSVRDWIVEAYPHVGRIELFARTAAAGWTAWGNQAPALAAE
jgi:N6-adenosine-specific RNA methylase IME4